MNFSVTILKKRPKIFLYKLAVFMMTLMLAVCFSGCRKDASPDMSSDCSVYSVPAKVDNPEASLGAATDTPSETVSLNSQPNGDVTATPDTENSIKTENPFYPENVISSVIKSISALGTSTVYTENVSNSDTFTLTADKALTQDQISGTIHDKILNALGYDKYLEFTLHPSQAQPALFDYTYSIKYSGVSADGMQHIFTLSYRLNPQSYISSEVSFNSDQAAALAAAQIASSDRVALTKGDGAYGYKEIITLNDVQTFNNTEEAAEKLSSAVINTVYGKNLSGNVNYTRFNILYYGKSDTYYTFLLYLA